MQITPPQRFWIFPALSYVKIWHCGIVDAINDLWTVPKLGSALNFTFLTTP